MGEARAQDVRLRLIEALEADAGGHDTDIVDVEVVGTKGQPCVRVRIDHADPELGPITLDEVSAATRWISDLIEEVDPIEGPYTLEVSSPGLARPLRKRSDFTRFCGQTVRVTREVAEGRRKFTGTLQGLEGDDVILDVDGERIAIAFDTIRTAKIKPSFD